MSMYQNIMRDGITHTQGPSAVSLQLILRFEQRSHAPPNSRRSGRCFFVFACLLTVDVVGGSASFSALGDPIMLSDHNPEGAGVAEDDACRDGTDRDGGDGDRDTDVRMYSSPSSTTVHFDQPSYSRLACPLFSGRKPGPGFGGSKNDPMVLSTGTPSSAPTATWVSGTS